MNVAQRVAVVTGGGGRIGGAPVARLACEGATVAGGVPAAIEDERFLILPQDAPDMYRRKGSDDDRRLRGMRRCQSSLPAQA